MITGAFYPKIDGSVVASANLIRGLTNNGIKVTLLTRGYGDVKSVTTWEGVKVVRVRQHGFALFWRVILSINLIKEGIRLTKKEHFDVIHAHGFSALLAAEALRVFRTSPVVVTFHGLQRLWNRGWGVTWRLRFYSLLPFEGFMVRRAQMVIAQSTLLKRSLVLTYRLKPGTVSVLQNPVDIDNFRPSELPKPSKTVLFVGTLGKIYGPDLLIRASKIVLEEIPDATFVFVGKGPAENELLNLTKFLGVESAIKFVGQVTERSIMEHYYASSRVLAVPFRGTGGYFLNLSELEAMAVGRPVIVSHETDEIEGVFYTKNDPETLAHQIVSILKMEQSTYTKLGRAARDFAVSCSSERIASIMSSNYASIARRPPSGLSRQSDYF